MQTLWKLCRQLHTSYRTTGKSFHSCLCDPSIVTHRGSRTGAHELDLGSLWSRKRKKKKEDVYRVEPELDDGCIVEFIDFSAQGDQPVSALNFLFILLSGRLPVVSSQHCLQWKRINTITAGLWRAGSSMSHFTDQECTLIELERVVQGPQRFRGCAIPKCAFALQRESKVFAWDGRH